MRNKDNNSVNIKIITFTTLLYRCCHPIYQNEQNVISQYIFINIKLIILYVSTTKLLKLKSETRAKVV